MSVPQRAEGTQGPAPDGRSRWLVPLVLLAVVALMIGAVLWIGGGGDGGGTAGSAATGESSQRSGAVEHPTEAAPPDLSDQEGRDPDDLLAEGPADAPVVLVMFTDYQCPYCAQWSHETLPALREYVERGELRIEYRDVNVYGDESERGAKASLAAAEQGHFEAYHDALFAGGEIRSPEELDEDSLVELAGELGLDTEQFRADFHSEEVAATIDANAQQGIELGAMSTPAFILDGAPMVGAQPTEVFTDALDEALAEAEG